MNIKDIIQKAGGVCSLARQLGVRHVSVIRWKEVPVKRLLEVERITGVPREELRPDIFRRERVKE